jgi:GAF domain-containing protein
VLELRTDVANPDAPSSRKTRADSASATDEETPGQEISFLDEQEMTWCRQLLGTLTYGALVVGLPAVAAAIYAAHTGGRSVLVPLWLGLYLLLALPLVWSEMSYKVKTGAFLGALYGVALLAFFQPGYGGDGTPFLLSATFFSTILLGEHVGAPSLVVAFATGALASWSSFTGLLFSQATRATASDPIGWLWSPVVIAVLGTGSVLVATRCRQRLDSMLERGRRLERNLTDRSNLVLAQEEDLERRAAQLAAADELLKLAAFQLDSEQVLRRVLEVVSDRIRCYSASIFLPDETGKRVELYSSTGAASAELVAQGLRVDVGRDSIVGWAAQHGEPYVALDVRKDAIYSPHLLLKETRSEAAIPLLADDRLVGVLDVHSRQQDAFDDTDVQFLKILGDWATLAFENRRLASARASTSGPAYRASHRLSAAATKGEVVDAIVDSIAETRASTCLVAEFLRTSDGELDSLLCLRAWRRGAEARLEPGARLPVSSTLFPADLLEGPWRVPDIRSDDRLSSSARDLFDRMGVRALVGLPLKGAGESFGQVLVLYADRGPFSSKALRLYELLQNQAGAALERAQGMEDAYRQARRATLASQATAALHESLNLEEVLSTAARDIARTMGLAAVDVRVGPPDAHPVRDDKGQGHLARRRAEGRPAERE